VELRLIVYASGVILGLAIIYAGLRLLARSRSGRREKLRQSRPAGPPTFAASGTVFLVTGVLMIAVALWMIGGWEHEVMTAVKPTSFMKLDAPVVPAEEPKPAPNEPGPAH